MAERIKNTIITTDKVKKLILFNIIYLKKIINSPIPGCDGNNPFSVAFNSLYNYGSSESNGTGSASMNGSVSSGINTNSQSTVARSTSSHNLDIEQENKRRRDLEYK